MTRLGLIALVMMVLVAVNLCCLVFVQQVWIYSCDGSGNLKELIPVAALLVQCSALLLGLFYFLRNAGNDRKKESRSKRNELLQALADEFKELKKLSEPFFQGDFKDSIALKLFKDEIIDSFAMLSIFVEQCEGIFLFADKDYGVLMAPSSIIQTSLLFTLQSPEDLKKHDCSALKSQFNSSLNAALGTCWSGLE